MSLVINTNISSLNAQNNLSKSQSALAQATERLSSGLQINSAADNAAGFAIATRFQTQIGGLATASNNASDAINLAQTAGSALDQVTSNLQAIRDLAVQAASGNTDRTAINTEVQQRLAEITRIANQTSFNGTDVLNGSASTLSFQVGADVGQVINVNLGQGVTTSQIGQVASTAGSSLSTLFAANSGGLTLAAGALTVNGTSVTGNFSGTNAGTALATAINAAAGSTIATFSGGQLSFSNSGTSAITIAGTSAASLGMPTTVAAATGTGTPTPGTATTSGTGLATALAAPAKAAGLTLGSGDLNIDGTSITGTFNSAQDLVDAINAATYGSNNVSAAVNANGGLNLYSSSAMTIYGNQAAAVTGVTSAGTTSSAAATIATSGSLQGSDVLSVDDANALISRVDAALSSVSTFSSTLGAIQNRFQSTIATLSAQSTNLQASQSSIQDANFAQETANLSKAQVLQQAGISVLATANSQPQQILKLLQ